MTARVLCARASGGEPRSTRGARRGENVKRDAWADAVKKVLETSRRSDPARALVHPALGDIAVVFCTPKIASNVGAFARSCAAFECVDLRLVTPACDAGSRAALSAAKGAQGLVRVASSSGTFDTLVEALVGCSSAVAFHPWPSGDVDGAVTFDDLEALADAFPGGDVEDGRKLALVFGNEADGLTKEEIAACDAVCTIPMGRLVESLSVTHAGVIALYRYYERRVRAGVVENR